MEFQFDFIKKLLLELGINEHNADALSDSLGLEIIDKTLFDILSQEQKVTFEELARDNDVESIKLLLNFSDKEKFILRLKHYTEEVIGEFITEISEKLPKENLEEFEKRIRKVLYSIKHINDDKVEADVILDKLANTNIS